MEQSAAYIEDGPGAALNEPKERFEKKCSLPALHDITRKMGSVFKKILKASEQEREGVAKNRDDWSEFQKTVDARRLIFLDESELENEPDALLGAYLRRKSMFLDSAPCGH